MKLFRPHNFQPKVIARMPIPTIYFTPEAFADMWILVDEVGDEVGWLGSVRRIKGGGYLVDKIYLIEQEISASTTELSEEGVSKLMMELLKEEDGVAKADTIRFWGHSHVNMDTFASATDNAQMQVFKENGCEYFIRAILNKRGRIQCWLYLYDKGLKVDDVPWAVHYQYDLSRRETWKKEIKDKLKKIAWSYNKGGYQDGYGAGYQGDYQGGGAGQGGKRTFVYPRDGSPPYERRGAAAPASALVTGAANADAAAAGGAGVDDFDTGLYNIDEDGFTPAEREAWEAFDDFGYEGGQSGVPSLAPISGGLAGPPPPAGGRQRGKRGRGRGKGKKGNKR